MAFQVEPRVPGLCEMCQDLQEDKDKLLFRCVKNGHLGCVKACIAAGADARVTHYDFKYNYDYFTPLVHAVRKGFDDIIEALIKAGAEITPKVLREIRDHGGSERCVSLILEAGGDADQMLRDAISKDRYNIVCVLIKAGAEITDENLEEAGWRYSEQYIKLILEAGGDPDVMLLSALKQRRRDILPLLIKAAGADVNNTQQSKAFEWAVKSSVQFNGIEYVKLLVEAGANVNNSQGVKALILAVGLGSMECVNLLIEGEVDVNASLEDYSSKTALFVAVTKGSSKCIQLLLKSGADVNIRDNKGRTALFTAVQAVSSQAIELLLKAGADVNSIDTDGKTVLFLSPIWFSVQRLNVYKLLLAQGVKVNIRNNHGFNALTHFLVDLENDQNYARCKTTNDDELEKEFVMLFFAAGETVDESKVKAPHYLKLPADMNLMNICRETIRKHLLQMSDVSLIYRVPKLRLPHFMTSFLLYNVTLKQEASVEH